MLGFLLCLFVRVVYLFSLCVRCFVYLFLLMMDERGRTKEEWVYGSGEMKVSFVLLR